MKCEHCGEEAQFYGTIESARVCHPNDSNLPDCYRRVTVYHERLGALKKIRPLPKGIDGLRDSGLESWLEYVKLSQEIAVPPAYCIAHQRWIPCRKKEGCVITEVPDESHEEVD